MNKLFYYIFVSLTLLTISFGQEGKSYVFDEHGVPQVVNVLTEAEAIAQYPRLGFANDFSAAQEISVNGAASIPALKLDGTIFTGGSATTTTPQLLVEPSGTTSNNWSTSGTLLGLNAPSGFSGAILDILSNNSRRMRVTASAVELSTVLNFTSSSTITMNSDAILGREAAATWKLGTNSATPITQTFKGPDARAGTDTNTAGGVLNIAAGRGTGTAAGGVLNLQTSEPTSSGTSAGTLTTRLAISGTQITPSLPIVSTVNGAASTPALKLDGTIFTGGTATTTTPQLLIEPAGTTSTTWSTSGTLVGINAPSGFSGRLLQAMVNNSTSARFYVDSLGNTYSNAFAATSTGYFFGSGSDTMLLREAVGILQMGTDAASPVTQTFKACDSRAGTDTNTAGGLLNIAAGRGTGTAAGGSIALQTSVATTSGTSAGSLSTREYFYGGEKSMTESSATTLVNIAFGTGKYIGGSLTATTHADDATDFQATTEHLTFSAVNKAGTVTATIQAAPSSSTTAASSGTLTTTWTIVDNGASVDIKNNAVSSLTQTTLKVSYKLTLNTDASTTITP